MERIASRLGEQNLPINVNDPELQDRKDWQDSLIRKNITEITGYDFLPAGEEQNPDDPMPVFELPVIGISNLQPSADGIFYYHTNHLGSTVYITDGNAIVHQGFLYAPFGETTNEYNSSFGNGVIPKYSFNAKELDEETGMYYYEARYMAPPTFISRDPLFKKYPTFSPYTYCANNPVMYVDPTGEEMNPVYDMDGNFIGTTKEGFTGQIVIFSGRCDFTNLTETEFYAKYDEALPYGVVSTVLSAEAKSNIFTDVVSHFEGLQVFDETFSMNSIDGSVIYCDPTMQSNWKTTMPEGRITGSGYFTSYEATVENIASTVIVHEWYSHFKKQFGNRFNNHRFAYKNVIESNSVQNNFGRFL